MLDISWIFYPWCNSILILEKWANIALLFLYAQYQILIVFSRVETAKIIYFDKSTHFCGHLHWAAAPIPLTVSLAANELLQEPVKQNFFLVSYCVWIT